MLKWRELIPALGAEITSHTATEVAAALVSPGVAAPSQGAAPGLPGAGGSGPGLLMTELAATVRERGLILLKGDGSKLNPEQLRALYKGLHQAMGIECTLPAETKPKYGESLQRVSLPKFPETQVLGHCIDRLEDWHGLTGHFPQTSDAWWHTERPNWHQDGGFSGSSPPPPAIVAMYCEEAPARGASSLRCWDGDAGDKDNNGRPGGTSPSGPSLPFEPGATLYFSTKLAMRLAPPDLQEKARRITCVYRRGFGKVLDGVFPIMSRSWLVPTAPAPPRPPRRGGAEEEDPRTRTPKVKNGIKPYMGAKHGLGPNGEGSELYSTNETTGEREFRHALVQRDEETGEEYLMVHSCNVDGFEEEGRSGPLPWSESMQLIEALLAPAARPPHVFALGWCPGDYAIWDNRWLMHNVTPTHRNGSDELFVALGERRLMTRTEMPSSWVPRRSVAVGASMAAHAKL